MRREGYIMEEVTDYGNMSEAFDAVLRARSERRAGKVAICWSTVTR